MPTRLRPPGEFCWFNLRAPARDAQALGAVLRVPPIDIPGAGRFCGITSPPGVTFCAIRFVAR